MKRIGIYGGTFNPIHMAHLITAEEVCEQMHLDKILFIPSANHPFKDSNGLLDSASRLKMVNMAIEGNMKFESSDLEIKLPIETKSYTVNTLLLLKEQYKAEQVKLYLIIGMDNLAELHKWKNPEKLFMLSEVVVINRPGYYIKDVDNEFNRQVTYVPVTNIDISSTEIRNRILENRSVKYLIPEAVENYITEHNLYKSNQ